MPYNLLYSRSIQNDSVIRILDVPIPERNVMIEVLSLISPFRRLFGYAYALRSDGLTDYERSGGFMLPFGKNRVNFAAATAPYFLELFPRRGITSGIISVYTGEPSPPEPLATWKQALYSQYQMRRNVSPRGASYRTDPTNETVDASMSGAIEPIMYYDFVFWKLVDGSCRYKQIGPPSDVSSLTSSEDYANKLADPVTIVL